MHWQYHSNKDVDYSLDTAGEVLVTLHAEIMRGCRAWATLSFVVRCPGDGDGTTMEIPGSRLSVLSLYPILSGRDLRIMMPIEEKKLFWLQYQEHPLQGSEWPRSSRWQLLQQEASLFWFHCPRVQCHVTATAERIHHGWNVSWNVWQQ